MNNALNHSDQFAVVPRHLAAGYFEAVRSFYRCISPMEQFEWFPNGVGESDMLLTKHLVDNEVKLDAGVFWGGGGCKAVRSSMPTRPRFVHADSIQLH